MANRFPLIVDSSGTAAIKELASGDNLDLTGNGIVGVGTVALTNLTVGGGQGSDGQVLTSTGSGIAWEDASGGGGGGAWNVISNTTVSSATTTVEFTSITGYTHYMIDISNLKSSANKELQVEAQYQGDTDYAASSYMSNKIYLNWASAASYVEYQTNQSKARISKDMSSIVGSVAQLWFGNSSSAISYKCVSGHVNTGGITMATGAMGNDNSAYRDKRIDKIRFSFQSGNIDAGTFTLYGLATS